MGAAAHLGIDLAEYDARIRTFIPDYDSMLWIVATLLRDAVRKRSPVVVDLGIGTGALSAECRTLVPRARIVGLDEDAGMLAAARSRLGETLETRLGSFESIDLPRCDAIVACLALHHVPTPARRLKLFRRIHRALRPGGVLISADCHPASSPRQRAADRAEWVAHLEASYSPAQARAYLRAWAREDHYSPLVDELVLLRRAGFVPDVPGRRRAFAVVLGTR